MKNRKEKIYMKCLLKELNDLKLGIFIISVFSIIFCTVLIKIEEYTKSLLSTKLIPFIILFTVMCISMLSAYNIKNNNDSDNLKKKKNFPRYYIYVIFIIIGLIIGTIISTIFLKSLNLFDNEMKELISNCILYSTTISFLLRFFHYTL